MKITKRLLAFALVLVMLFGMFPAQANAATTGAEHDHSETTADVQPQATGAVKVEHNGETTYYADLQKAFDGFAPNNNTYGGKYVVTLEADTTGLNKNLQYPTEVLDITLDLNGHTITGNGSTVAVVINYGSANSKDCVFTIKDSSGSNAGMITGGKGGVKLDGKGSFLYFQGGTITGNHGASKGGGIFMGATAKLIMTGGVITGNSVQGSSSANSGYGGGVLANYADILGGAIYGNVAKKGSHLQTGRGGGVCTEITRTSGYNVLNIASGVVYGNTAENAGDDVMAQGNGMSGAKFTLIVGTENWYIDGWNGTKAGSGGGQTARYDAENPVAYTDGGFTGTDGTGVKNKTLGLKYVASSSVEYTVTYTDGVEDAEIFADQVYTVKEGEATPTFEGEIVREGYTFTGWAPEVAETVTEEAVYVAQWKENARGDINGVAFRGDNKGLSLELHKVLAYETIEVKVYSGEALLTTLSLRDIEENKQFLGAACNALTVSIRTIDESTSWAATEWIPLDDVVPTKYELYIDGQLMDTHEQTVDVEKWNALEGTKIPEFTVTYTDGVENAEIFADQTHTVEKGLPTPAFEGEIVREGFTFMGWAPEVTETVTENVTYVAQWHEDARGDINGIAFRGDNEGLSIELHKVLAYKTIEVKVYSGETLLTTLSLRDIEENKQFLGAACDAITVSFRTYDESTSWAATEWAPADDVVPTKYELYIDGQLMDTHEQTVDVEKWNALKGTKAPEYTVVYTDGVEDEEVFADQTYTVERGMPTPAFEGTPARQGYNFLGWEPAVAETVTAPVTYVARWEAVPVARLDSTGETFTSLQAAIDAAQAIMVDAATENQTVTLLSDIQESVEITWIPTTVHNFYLTINLNGHTVTGNGGPVFEVGRYSSAASTSKMVVTFDDSVGTAVVTGGNATNGGAIYVSSKNPCDIVINGGTWTGNHATSAGGVLYAAYVGTNNITVNGGTFTGNTAGTNGGAFTARYLYINGGTITGNTANSGGGVYVFISGATKLELNGGAIYGNTASTDGDDIIWRANSGSASTAYMKLIAAEEMGVDVNGWYRDDNGARFSEENAVKFENYAKYTTLKTRVALKAANYTVRYTVTYTDGVENAEIFADQVYTVKEGEATPAFEGEIVREGFTFLGWAPEVTETVTENVTYVAQWKENARGDINGIAFRGDNEGLSIELHKVLAYETIEVKVYSGETLLTTLSLRDIEENKQFLGAACNALTVSFRTYDESTSWAATEWTPADDVVPTKYELYIDGVLMDTHEQTVDVAKWNALKGTRAAMPALPENNGSNVTEELITVICDTDEGHTSRTYGWDDPAANIVFPKGSEPVWNEELNAWTIGVRMDSIETYYVNLRFSKEHNGIQHQINGEGRIDTTLVWDEAAQKWQTLTGEAFEIHVGCQTAPEVPGIGYFLSNMKIKMIGTVDGAEKVWFESLHRETVTMGEVYGNRAEGFFVDATVVLDDSYVAAWVEKHAPGKEYTYAADTAETVTFTLKYTGNTTGELYDGPENWAIAGDYYRTVNVEIVPPAAPDKYGDNVTPDLIQVICDSDPNHEPMNIDWQSQSTKVYPGAQVEWNEELNTWTIKVRIDGISVYYVWLNYEKSHNDILHPLVDENQKCIDTYLKWDEEKQLWVTLDGEPIAVHVACQTAPTAPTSMPSSFQIQVKGDLDGDGIYGETKKDCALGVSELRAVTIPAGGYTLGEVYGSREEGFFVDVTVTLEDGDAFITTWMEYCAPEGDYIYNWNKTEKTVTFTLKYNRSTTGTLYGSNRSDWAANFSGYKVGEAYVIPAAPAAPKQDNVTDKLVAVICDSDSERHETVYGKWYPQHCKTTSDMVWNEELGTWTVDIRIGSLYIMYVDQLEDANYGTTHELVEDITTVYSTLVWDAEQNLWVPVEAIELHTTCRTAPLAPEYKQLKGYQLKVKGDLDGDGVWGENKATNNGILEQYSTNLPENGYTISEVYGSREEGFFVDVTFTLENGDIYLTNWNEKCAPCYTYAYDWEQTEKTVTFTLKYNGSLNGTLYGNRHATNTNYDWVLVTNDNHYGVVAEAYVNVDPNGPTYHEYESTVEEPTCTEGGYTMHICSVCGDYYTDAETEALGHDLGEAYVVTEPTCTEAGESRQDCSRCDHFVTAEIKALGHKYQDVVTEPNCTDGGFTTHTCTVCEDVYVDELTPALGHDMGEWTVTKQPTTSAEGEQVRSCRREGCTYQEKQSIPKRDKLDTPEVIKLENVQEGIRITWNKVEGAEKYRVYVKTANGWLNLGNTVNTRFVYTGVESGKSYTFTVRCVNNACNEFTSGYNTTGWTHTFVASPVVTKVESTTGGVKITWNAVAGAENYRVFVRNGNSWKTLANTGSTSFTWTGAEAGQTYIFTVRCLSADGTSYISYCNTTGWEHTYYPTPEVTSFESTTGGLKLTWSKIRGAGKYRVYAKTSNGWVKVGDTTSNSFTWTGAKAGLTYYFTVRAMNADATAFVSAYNNAGWSSTYMPTPAVTKFESTTSGLKLTWGAINGAGKYRVYVQNANGGWTKVGDTTDTSFVWTGAKTGERYVFTVRCLNAAGTAFVSAYNTTGWSASYVPAPAVTKLESTANGVKLEWSAINGAGKYRVFVKTEKGWTRIGDTTGTSFTWAAAKAGVTYTFTVRCTNAAGDTYTSAYNTTGWTITHN